HHIAAISNKSQKFIYVDGVLQKTATSAHTSLQNSNIAFAIGADFSSGTASVFLNGSVDEVRVSSVERSPDEIRVAALQAPAIQTYYQELPADEQTVGLWHFNEGTDNTCSGGQDACD